MHNRFMLAAFVTIGITSLSLESYAEKPSAALVGTPVVRDSSVMMLGGRSFSLWGVMPLAGDQKCWNEKSSWDCGEQATIALKHFAENGYLECHIMDEPVEGRLKAQCFRKKGDKSIDVAQFMVRHGWAMDDAETSGGQYAKDQEEAVRKKRGIWGSRFQTAEDWRAGIQKFVECPEDKEKDKAKDKDKDQ